MGGFSSDNFHAMKKNALVKLVKGKESAIQLRALLLQPVQDQEQVSSQRLALQIFRSFSDSLSELSSCAAPTVSDQIPAVDCGGSSCSAESKKKLRVKDRRGCYKRRRTSDSWVTVSPTMEDGCAWRKYGQKAILNSEFPRSYFRCTHKHDDCKALKQVQRVQGDEELYQTTYFNHHSCKQTLRAPPLTAESDPVDPNLISFRTRNNQGQKDDHERHGKPFKQTKQEASTSEEAGSTLEDAWHGITGLEPLGYKPVWAPYRDELESGLHELDMGVNHLSDFGEFSIF